MKENILFNGSIRIAFGKNRHEIIAELKEGFDGQDFLYSYLVKQLTAEARFVVTYMISQTERYNTIKVEEAVNELAITLSDYKGEKKIVCYRQPPAEILVEVFEPLVRKLARQQQEYWRHLEYEDLCQTCYLVICELVNKGYYVHRSLVNHCFNNAVLLSLRHERDKPAVVSIYDKYHGATDDLEKLTIGDMLVDDSYDVERELSEHEEFIAMTFDLVKKELIKLIGPRQFDQLFRDYGHKHTTAQTRRMMQKVKAYFAARRITMEDFINKYYG